MCVLPQSDILNKDLDKFKVSVSIFYGSVISKSFIRPVYVQSVSPFV